VKIDNLSLQTKALIPLAVMCLAVAGIVGFGAWRLDDLSRSAGEIIAHRDKAAIFVARATGTTMMAPYSAFGALVYDGSSPEGRTAQADFSSQFDKFNSLMDQASQYLPQYGSTFAGLKAKSQEIGEKGKKIVAIGEDSPGLAAGKDLKPDDLDKLADGARAVAEVDADARKLAGGLLAVSDTMINENARSAADMARQSQFALIALVIAGLVSALVAGAMTVWISTMKTARPLAELSRRMNALAAGDFEVEIGGVERNFKLYNPVTSTTYTATGGGGFLDLHVELFKGFRVLTNNFWSDGGGRYIFGQAPDLIAHADGSISLIHASSTVSGFEETYKKTMIYAYYGGIYVGRNVAIDTTGKPVGYGYTGSSSSQNRTIQEATFCFNQTIWKNAKYGALNFMGQYSYLTRNPWYVASGQPANANINILFFNLRYTLPGSAPTLK